MTEVNGPNRFLSPPQEAEVEAAIAEAERRTSAEIKVVIKRVCFTDIRVYAKRIFRRLELEKTAERNAVLILLVTANREFLIYGDEGIHEKVGLHFWADARDEMRDLFAEGCFAEGLVRGVRRAGDKLSEHFPWREGDVDEIDNKIVYDM